MRIGLCGTISCRKSTLVNELSKLEQFKDYKCSTERSKYLRDLGIPLNTDSTVKGQLIFMAERSSELFSENLITDRSIIDVMAFTELSKSISNGDKTMLNSCASTLIKEYDIIFYVSPIGVEIEDNSVRTTDPEYRVKIDQTIKMLLNYYPPKKLVTLYGPTDKRIEDVLKHIL